MAAELAPFAEAEVVQLMTRIKASVAASNSDDTLSALVELTQKRLPVKIMNSTKIHIEVNRLQKDKDEKVASKAKELVAVWKKLPVRSNSTSTAGGSPCSTPKSPAAAGTPTGKRERSEQPSQPNKKAAVAAKDDAASGGATPAAEKRAAIFQVPSGDLKTGDPKRDKCQAVLCSALKAKEEDGDFEPALLAYRIEKALFKEFKSMNEAYLNKLRSIKFNLSDPKNPDFVRKLLTGVITPEETPTLTAHQMASNQTAEKNKEVVEHAVWSIGNFDLTKTQAVTDIFQCSRCGERACTFTQKQTRSADEPMTTFVQCIPCGKRWRFS